MGGTQGWTRLAFSAEEEAVHSYAARCLQELGFTVSFDAFRNLFARLPGALPGAALPVMLGTHLDTVKNGGNYDGVVGFIVAVEAVSELLRSGRPRPNIVIAIFRAEESTRFKKACLGSRAAFLGLDQDTLELSYEDDSQISVTLSEAVAAAGGTLPELDRPSLDPAAYRAYFETHIEQARTLEQRIGLNGSSGDATLSPILGIVTSIRAPHRCEWETSGPKSIKLFSRCVIAVENAAILANRFQLDAVATVGRVEPNFVVGADKINAIPGRIEIPLSYMTEELFARGRRVAGERRCTVEVSEEGSGRRLCVKGVTDHSGGTPMGIEHRQDALVAACEILLQLPDGMLPRCERIVFATDVRSNSVRARDFVGDLLEKSFEAVERLTLSDSPGAGESRIEKIRRTERSEPVTSLAPELQAKLAEAAEKEGFASTRLPSGAGHDAMMAAIAGIRTAMLFIASRNGLSHTPEEWSRTTDIAAAVKVQARALETLAGL